MQWVYKYGWCRIANDPYNGWGICSPSCHFLGVRSKAINIRMYDESIKSGLIVLNRCVYETFRKILPRVRKLEAAAIMKLKFFQTTGKQFAI